MVYLYKLDTLNTYNCISVLFHIKIYTSTRACFNLTVHLICISSTAVRVRVFREKSLRVKLTYHLSHEIMGHVIFGFVLSGFHLFLSILTVLKSLAGGYATRFSYLVLSSLRHGRLVVLKNLQLNL